METKICHCLKLAYNGLRNVLVSDRIDLTIDNVMHYSAITRTSIVFAKSSDEWEPVWTICIDFADAVTETEATEQFNQWFLIDARELFQLKELKTQQKTFTASETLSYMEVEKALDLLVLGLWTDKNCLGWVNRMDDLITYLELKTEQQVQFILEEAKNRKLITHKSHENDPTVFVIDGLYLKESQK